MSYQGNTNYGYQNTGSIDMDGPQTNFMNQQQQQTQNQQQQQQQQQQPQGLQPQQHQQFLENGTSNLSNENFAIQNQTQINQNQNMHGFQNFQNANPGQSQIMPNNMMGIQSHNQNMNMGGNIQPQMNQQNIQQTPQPQPQPQPQQNINQVHNAPQTGPGPGPGPQPSTPGYNNMNNFPNIVNQQQQQQQPIPQQQNSFSNINNQPGPMNNSVQGGSNQINNMPNNIPGGMNMIGMQNYGPKGSGSPEDLALFKVPSNSTNSIYVDGIPIDASEREVAHIFRPFPGFQEVRLIKKESKTGRQFYFCFVDFENSLQATIALNTLQSYRFDKEDPKGLKISYAFHAPETLKQKQNKKSAKPMISHRRK